MSSLDYLDLCRLCLVKDRVSMPIFEGEGDIRQIFLKITACLPVKVAREDKLPKKICDDCVYKLELTYQFWHTTANAEKQLLQWLGEVNMEDKQGYVGNVLNPNGMKPDQSNENRLDGTVMQQVSEHQNNMTMGMMDNMGLTMMMSSSTQQQITSVPIDNSGSSVQNVQPLAGPSTQATHDQITQNQTNASTQQEEEEESSEEEENSDDECDGDEGLPIKEESEEDPNNRTIEPTTFVNVSLACDEAGPSGLQQQKIADMPEMVMSQTTDVDPKTGEQNCSRKILQTDASGCFIVGKESIPMRLWQHDDVGGKLRYSLIPALDSVAKAEEGVSVLDVSPLTSIKVEETEDQSNNRRVSNVNSSMDSSVHQIAIDNHTCKKCSMKFPMQSMLNRHKIMHKMGSWFGKKPENIFLSYFRSREKYARRLKINARGRLKAPEKRSKEAKYVCTFCNFSCNRQATLNAHVKRKHEEDTMKTKKLACTICDYECLSEASLNRHMSKHRGKSTTSFACNMCDFECKRSTTLASHLTRNHKRPKKDPPTAGKRRRITKCNYASSEKSCSNMDKTTKKAGLITYREDSDLTIKEEICMEEDCKVKEGIAADVPKKSSPKSIGCDLCDFTCVKKSTLYSHKRRHRLEDEVGEVFACNECGFKTGKKSSLYSHIKRKHKEPRGACDTQPELFYCNQCDYKNKNKYELKIHVARKHSDDFKFSCETCGKKFKVKGDLTNHIRFSHREQPVICDVCGKTCLNSNSLYVHQKFAHYKAKYECQICKRRMVSQENLDEHMLRQHERRENVVCEECGKTFSRNSRLKVHMRIHTGDKPYSCTVCNKSFARRTALKQHLLIHTGIRPYVCDICGKAFTQKPGLISHRKSHPGSHPPLPRVLIDHILNDVMNA